MINATLYENELVITGEVDETTNIFLSQLRPGDYDEAGECFICQEDGACRNWVETMADDADVPEEWLAMQVIRGWVNCDWSVVEVSELLEENEALYEN